MIKKNISHYKIIDKIGEGGMGEVFLAEDTKLKRKVALKFLPQEFTKDKEAVERFQREAQAAAALNHPNIITIYEINKHEDQTYIAMEYVPGRTLKEIIDENSKLKTQTSKLSIERVMNIGSQLCQGLSKAHQAGIVHRDIKPQNILIDKDGRVKILDFGLAKLKGVGQLTKETSTLGTVHYMSPEQAMGKEVDHRTDIWSLGVILYEMITGHMPFKGDYEQAVIYSILNEHPEPPTSSRTEISSELEKIISQMLAKKPEERFQKMDIINRELSNSEQDSKAETTIKRTGEKASMPKRKSIYIMVISIMVLVLMIVIGRLFIFQDKKISKKSHSAIEYETEWQNSIAVLPFIDMSSQKDQDYFCDGMTEDIITKLARIKELKVISRTSVMRYKNTEKDIKTIGRELAVNTILEGSIRKEGQRIRISAQLINIKDDSHLWANTYDRKLESIFDLQDEVSKAIAYALEVKFGPVKLAVDRPKNIKAYEYYLKARHLISTYLLTKRDIDFQKSVEMAGKALDLDPNYALMYAVLAWIHNNRYAVTLNPEDQKPVIENCLKAYRLNPNLAEANTAMAWVYFTEKNYDKTAYHFKKALELNSNISENNHSIGVVLYRLGLYPQARKYLHKAEQLNPFYLFTPLMLGYTHMNMGEMTEARAYFKKSLELAPKDLNLLHSYIQFLIMMREIEEAEEVLSKTLEINPQYYEIPISRAYIYAAKGEKDKALAIKLPGDWQKCRVYALLGMKEEALKLITKGAEQSYLRLLNIPFYDSLREHKDYKKVLENLKKRNESFSKIFHDL